VLRFDIADRREDVQPTMAVDEAELNANAFAAYLLIPDQMSTHATKDAWLAASFFDVPRKIVEWRRTLPMSLWLRHIVAARMPHGRIERRGGDIDPHG
jgi:Zn-dependent peptidase ImmA (M78 family)